MLTTHLLQQTDESLLTVIVISFLSKHLHVKTLLSSALWQNLSLVLGLKRLDKRVVRAVTTHFYQQQQK